MTPISSKLRVHLRSDRSITQFMLENVCNTDFQKVILEDTLTDRQATYGGIRDEAFRGAYSLRHEYGLRPGDTVSIISRSCVDYVLATHAIWAAGGIVSTINHSNTAEEIAFAIKIVKPVILFVDSTTKSKVDEAVRRLGGVCQTPRLIALLARVQGRPLFPDDLLRSRSRISPDAYVLDGQDAHKKCAAVVLSSGTSGLPKAVMLSHHNLIAICEMLRHHNSDNWRGDMREVFFPPLSHIYGLYVCALMGPWLGSYVSLMHAFDMETFCKLLQAKKATLARLVPTVALALSESPIVSRYKYPDLEYFSCAGAVLKPNVAAKLRQKFPGVSLCQTYGCTETSSCISQSGVRDLDAPSVATGTLLSNISIRFIDDQLQDVPMGQPGEICVSCPTVMMGYKDNDKATRESMLTGNWYRTGDIGYLDSKGYLIIIDRIKDVIKYKGFQVSPTELEEIIMRHPLVADAAVTSTWSESEATELPRAYIVPNPTVTQIAHAKLAKEVIEIIATSAAGYKKLRGGVRFVESLPKSATGKVLRRELRTLDREERARL